MNSIFFNKTDSTRWKILLITHKKSCNRFLSIFGIIDHASSTVIEQYLFYRVPIPCLPDVCVFLQYACTNESKWRQHNLWIIVFSKNTYKPLSLSTRITTTHSFLPTLISLLIERIRLLDNSLRRIIPSMLLYSNKFTYAPISAMLRTFTITTSSISGYLCL